jgi:hypothetical protein
MDTAIAINGYASVGLVFVWLVLASLWFITWLLGKELWRRLKRTYHFTVILYWLDRLEEGGVREFKKAEAEDAEKKEAGNADR